MFMKLFHAHIFILIWLIWFTTCYHPYRWACLSESYVFLLALRWAVVYISGDRENRQLRLDRFFQYMHSTHHCHCHCQNPFIFCVLLRHTDARRSKLNKEKHLVDILIPGLVMWTALHQSYCFAVSKLQQIILYQNYNKSYCFAVSKLQHEFFSINDSPPLHCLLNKLNGAETSQWDCRAWLCNCLDHFHDTMADLASIYLAVNY